MFGQALSASKFLAELPAPIQAQLSALAKPQDYATGAEIFSEGQVHDQIYLVESGHVRLSMFVPQRGAVPMLTVGPGEFLGWSPLFGKSPMSATAVVTEPTRCWGFSGTQLSELCAKQHDVGYSVMRQLAVDLSKRLIATRLQLLDMYKEQQPLSAAQRDPAKLEK